VGVTVRIDGRSLLDQPVPVRVNSYSASVATTDVVLGGGSAGVTVTASLSAGGFLALHEGSTDTVAFDVQVPDSGTPTPTDTPPGPTPTATPTETGTPPTDGTTPDNGTPGTPLSDGDSTATESLGDPDIGGTILPVIGLLIAGALLVAFVRVR